MRAIFLAMSGVVLILAGCTGQDRDTGDGTASYGSSGVYADPAPGADALVAPVAPPDLEFVTQASYGGIAQVQVAGLAEQLAVDPAVRDDERLLAADAGPAGVDLAEITRSLGLTAPTASDAGREQTFHMLQTLAGPRFDHAYIAVQRIERRVAVALYEGEAAAGHDPRLREFAEQRLPILRQQLARIEELARRTVSSAR